MPLPRSLPLFLLVVTVPVVLGACSPAEDELGEEAPPAATPAPAAPEASAPMTGSFTALNDSGLSGDIEVSGEGEQTRVVVRLSGSQADATHQGHIHSGTCESPGSVVAPLQPVTIGADGSGEATSTVAVAPMTAMDGAHIVLYHEANGSPGAPVACAPVPQHTM